MSQQGIDTPITWSCGEGTDQPRFSAYKKHYICQANGPNEQWNQGGRENMSSEVSREKVDKPIVVAGLTLQEELGGNSGSWHV